MPFSLRFKAKNDVWEMTEINTTSQWKVWTGTEWCCKDLKFKPSINCKDNVKGYGFELHEVKPILRPLSDLTKEIEHNGVRITMMEEIAKIERPNIMNALNKVKDITVFNRGMSFTSRKMGVAYRYEDTVIEITHYKDAVFHKKVTHGNDSWVFSYFHNYPAIIDKLLEWHFDIFGLLDDGLAIDINELNNK